MMKILKMIKTGYRDRRIIRELYKHQTTSIKINESKREATNRKGVMQGCKWSALLFYIYTEQTINERNEHCTRIKVNGKGIRILSFADDIEIKAQDEINLKRALERSDDISKSNYRMKINRIKTEAIVCSRYSENINIKVDEDALKQVPKFKHLGNIPYVQKMEKIRKTSYSELRNLKLYLIIESNYCVRITLVWKWNEKL